MRLVERGYVARHPRRPGQKEHRYEQLLGGSARTEPPTATTRGETGSAGEGRGPSRRRTTCRRPLGRPGSTETPSWRRRRRWSRPRTASPGWSASWPSCAPSSPAARGARRELARRRGGRRRATATRRPPGIAAISWAFSLPRSSSSARPPAVKGMRKACAALAGELEGAAAERAGDGADPRRRAAAVGQGDLDPGAESELARAGRPCGHSQATDHRDPGRRRLQVGEGDRDRDGGRLAAEQAVGAERRC